MKFLALIGIVALIWLVGLFAFAERVRSLAPATEPERADAIVARAEIAARRGDLTTAINELSGLRGPGAGAAAGWLKSARNRLALARTRLALDKIILSRAVAGDRS